MRAAAIALATALAAAPAAQEPLVLDPALHHLGDSHVATWEGVPPDPEGPRLELRFPAQRNAAECVLELRCRDADERWTVAINDRVLGVLERDKRLRPYHFAVPPDTLADGDNRLVVATDKPADDIAIGDVHLHLRPLRDVLELQPVRVQVRAGDGRRLPAKVTVTDAAGEVGYVHYGERLHTATRKGIAYTADGEAAFELSPGDWTLTATRGAEWGIDRRAIRVARDAPGTAPLGPITLVIEREVDTTGFVAADTHVHTLTFSGHGDASVEERMVTLAGEGVELAVATDHNHHTDYRPAQERMGLHEHFTPVVGNEVTTEVGHMNAFPLDPKAAPPDHTLKDWIALVDGIRAKGAKVVVLNHPRWPQLATGPLGTYRFDRITGDFTGQKAMPWDAMELANATALLDDPMYLFTDWFALLNHGEKITAVGTSDSHTVGDPVGQGRTYVRSSTDAPAKIDVGEACRSFLAGDTTISLGIFCDVVVEGRWHMGDTVPAAPHPPRRAVSLSLRVAAPSWVRPRTARVFANGAPLAEAEVPARDGVPTDARIPFTVALPAHDAWLVCVVVGDGVSGAHWRTEKRYTLAATNPVWLDVDGDGKYTSPRALAQAMLDRTGLEPAALRAALSGADDAVALQALSLARRTLEAGADAGGATTAGAATAAAAGGTNAGGAGADASAAHAAGRLAAARAQLRAIAGEPPDREAFAHWLRALPAIEIPAGVEKSSGGSGRVP